VLDGVYRCDTEGEPVFVEASAPSDEALQTVWQTIITRMMKLLTRKGVLVEEQGQTTMADNGGDSDEARTLRPLQAAACTYRIAVGPRAGQKVLTLQGVMPRAADFRQTLCADIQGQQRSRPPCAAVPTTARRWSNCAAPSRVRLWPTSGCKPTLPDRSCSSSRPSGETAEIDMAHCPNRGGQLKIIAAILEQPVIEKILTHLGPRPAGQGAATRASPWVAAASGLSASSQHVSGGAVARAAGICCASSLSELRFGVRLALENPETVAADEARLRCGRPLNRPLPNPRTTSVGVQAHCRGSSGEKVCLKFPSSVGVYGDGLTFGKGIQWLSPTAAVPAPAASFTDGSASGPSVQRTLAGGCTMKVLGSMPRPSTRRAMRAIRTAGCSPLACTGIATTALAGRGSAASASADAALAGSAREHNAAAATLARARVNGPGKRLRRRTTVYMEGSRVSSRRESLRWKEL